MKLAFFLPALSLFLTGAGAEPVILTPSTALSPGQTLIIEIPSQQHRPPLLLWDQNEIPFYFSYHKKWRALVRVPLDAKAGLTKLKVRGTIGRSTKEVEIPFEINLLASQFGEETLEFPEEKAALLNDPSEDEESRLIRERLKKAEKDLEQYWRGPFEKPIPGEVISPYGIRRNKIGQIKKNDFHRGIDLKGEKGEGIRAPNHGLVLLAENLHFHGKTVLLSHGQGIGSITIHMDELRVKEGQKVKKGDIIGTVGSTGLATAPHLHWGIYVHRKAVDPLQWCEVEF